MSPFMFNRSQETACSRKWGPHRLRREAVLVLLGSPGHMVVLRVWSLGRQAQRPWEPVRNAGAQARPRPLHQKLWGQAQPSPPC